MKKSLIGVTCLATIVLSGQNLVREGDFTNVTRSLDGFAMTNGAGIAVLFAEKDTGNKCVKLAISKVVKTPKNTELTAACLWIPCTRQNLGSWHFRSALKESMNDCVPLPVPPAPH